MQEKNSYDALRHTSSHILAAAVFKIFPDAKFAIGPAIADGFYYDFELPRALIPEDLSKIEHEMSKIIRQNLPVEHTFIPKDEALKAANIDQPYKAELINELNDEKISFYRVGEFIDLCIGPHVKTTGEIKAFKLLSIAGAYWRGDEKNKMLTRIYGTSFPTQKELDEHLHKLEEAKKCDHRTLGKEMEIFLLDETVGKGLPLWLPKGAVIRQILERFIEDEETKRGYHRTYTPVIGNVKLYKISGHWDHYKEGMYPPMKIEGEEYVLRPMTCPHQFMIYKSKTRSYRDLPIRLAELAEMYRKERSGELSGLSRVMGFTLNDAHIICRPDQLEDEFLKTLDLVQYSLKKLGLESATWVRASLRDKNDKKYLSSEKLWEESEKMLLKILKKANVNFETAIGEAAFYGPKADFQIKNIHGKEETLITIQIDLNSADRFDMAYVDEKGKNIRPVIIHRSAIGCIERTVAFLLEKHCGNLPLWLSPIQAQIIPVSEKVFDYSCKVFNALKEADVRVEADMSNETVGKKIRNAEIQKIPYILVVGPKEVEKSTQKDLYVSVRSHTKGDEGQISLAKFLELFK